MADINICPQCGIPLYISSQHEWMDNGVIQASRETRHRLVLFESGNLDPLFAGIADLIGTPIQRLVIDASRRSTRSYMDRIVADDLKDMIRSGDMDLKLVFDSTFLIWRSMGYGKLSLEDVRHSGSLVNARYDGLRSVPVARIRGSEGRSEDFDGSLRPLSRHTMGRWLSIAIARGEGRPLPPVSLIQVGETYFVRDGHHRVSVARAFGQEMIDAEVTVWTIA